MITDEEAESIVLLSRLTGISEEAAARHLKIEDTSPTFDCDVFSWEATCKIIQARIRLDNEFS